MNIIFDKKNCEENLWKKLARTFYLQDMNGYELHFTSN